MLNEIREKENEQVNKRKVISASDKRYKGFRASSTGELQSAENGWRDCSVDCGDAHLPFQETLMLLSFETRG